VLVNNPQIISFDLSKNTLTYGDSAPVVTASTTSALPVTITSSVPGVVSVGPNNILSIGTAGTAVLTANQAGDGTWAAADPVQLVVTVNKAPQTITFALNPATAKVGDPTRILIATSDVDLPVSLSSSDANVAVVNGYTLSIVGSGTATITATQGGSVNYFPAIPVFDTLTVSPSGFASWNGGSGVMTSDRLLKYAVGGASSFTGESEATTSLLGASTFAMTAVIRTDDSLKLGILPKATTSLTEVWDYPVTVTGKADGVSQAGVGIGWERKVFTVNRSSNAKIFMKIEVSYTP